MDIILHYIGDWPRDWIDALWIPLALFAVHKNQRIMTLGYLLSCMFVLRLQVELMVGSGYATGFVPLLGSHVMIRGLITYSIFHTLFILLAYYSKGSNKHVFLAATTSIFFAALLTSMVIMVL